MRIALALAILLAAAPARAGNNEVTVGSFFRALRSPSANAITDASLIGSEVEYARRIIDLPRLALWATVDLTAGGADGSMFQTIDTHLVSVGLSLGGRARYELHRNIALHARFDAGAANATLDLSDTMGHSASDDRWGAVTRTAVGADLLAYASKSFTFGLRFELGYVLASAIHLDAKPEGATDDELELAMSRASLGGLDIGGRFFGVSMLGQF